MRMAFRLLDEPSYLYIKHLLFLFFLPRRVSAFSSLQITLRSVILNSPILLTCVYIFTSPPITNDMMPSTLRWASITGLMALLPAARAGFNPNSEDNLSVYWGM